MKMTFVNHINKDKLVGVDATFLASKKPAKGRFTPKIPSTHTLYFY